MFIAVCHQSVHQAHVTRNLCYKLLLSIPYSARQKDIREMQRKLHVLGEQFENHNPAFTAAGFFEINYSLITAAWTYMVSNLIISLTFKGE